MKPLLTLGEAQSLLPGSRLVGDAGIAFTRVHSDTRTLQPGDLYVALRGERFDGHDFIAQAQSAGAVAALAERGLADTAGGMPGLQVPDALAALQQLAAAWRLRHSLPLIAVTGSNGKTTVTQMVAAILRAWCGDAALATAGNYNNHIGVPLTLLRLRPAHRVAVLELGMNHPGEITLLARLAAPTVGLINNAQREHQEFMDNVEAVARENGAVIDALGAAGTVVIPAVGAHALQWRARAGARKVQTFALAGEADDADFEALAQWQPEAARWALELYTPAGRISTTLHQPGLHNARNALAATACAMAAGAPLSAVVQGLAGFAPVAGRSQLQRLHFGGRTAVLIDDSYNANPDSVLAAIAVLADMPAPRWLVLGDMGEVGARGPHFHAEVGAAARRAGIEHVWTAGALSAHAAAQLHFDSVALLLQALPARAPEAASVLVKGSRFMQMEQVVQALQRQAAQGAPHAA